MGKDHGGDGCRAVGMGREWWETYSDRWNGAEGDLMLCPPEIYSKIYKTRRLYEKAVGVPRGILDLYYCAKSKNIFEYNFIKTKLMKPSILFLHIITLKHLASPQN